MDGRFGDVEPLVERWIAIGGPTIPSSLIEAPAQHLFALRREQGRLAEFEATVLAVISEVARAESGIGSATQDSMMVYWRCRQALLDWELGRPVQAKAALDQLAAHVFVDVDRDHWWLTNMALLGELCALIEDTDRAAIVFEMLHPHADRHVSVGAMRRCYGSAAYYLGLLATTLERWDAAESYFEQALAMNERMGALPFVAHTQHAWAEMLLHRGKPSDRQQALDLTRAALATAEQLGMTRLAGQAQALLDILTSTKVAKDVAAARGLSPRELDVLRLLIDGRSDREIAAALFISHRTVMTHVANILNKLGVSSRTAAASLAIRDSIV
jgi:ATP/maltotriose-dependent transcriptional regulator MalT